MEVLTPYGDPVCYNGFQSPYLNSSHRKFQHAMRKFVQSELEPYVSDWEEKKEVPSDLHRKAAECGILPACVGTPWLSKYAGTYIAGDIKVQEWDPFHELIFRDELGRIASYGVVGALTIGLSVGLPPVISYGGEHLQNMVASECLKGLKKICLAITEPEVGSDVAAISTTAVLKHGDEEDYYIVNGLKKWISNGTFADYFCTAVKTNANSGHNGISLLLIPRTSGVVTRPIHCQGFLSSGTAFVEFNDVKVPSSYLIGQEGMGFKYIAENFNHERFGLAATVCRMARVAYEDAFQYSFKRKTFGKYLFEHPVIRNKLATMVSKIEPLQSYLEFITYQKKVLDSKTQQAQLAGPIALLKANATQTLLFCAMESAQILGAQAYTRNGQGDKVERIIREIVGTRIPGGSEEIMLELAMKMAGKLYSQRMNSAKILSKL